MTVELVPIRAACAMYGLNANTLRAWERRYGIIQPVRGEGGQRGFGPQDLERIRAMVELTGSGISPSQAAQQILGGKHSTPKVSARMAKLQSRFRDAVQQLATDKMLRILHESETAVGYQQAVEQVLFPALAHLGEHWRESSRTIAEEHCASLAARTYLSQHYARRGHIAGLVQKSKLPVITLACVPEELHDLPVLHVANLLIEGGKIRPAVLASGLPLEETLNVADDLSASLLLLSATMRPTAAQVREWTQLIITAGWEERCLLAGSGFSNSRIFSETRLRAAAGSYTQVVELLVALGTRET